MSKLVSFLRAQGPIPTLNKTPATGGEPILTAVNPEQRSLVFAAAGILLAYPTDTYPQTLDTIELATADLSEEIAAELRSFIGWARSVGVRGVETTYVETFDQKRRCALELTYYATGDTRQRGIALTIFADLYAALGWELDNKELPDFLPNLLELAARTTDADDMRLINDVIATHREGIEVLHSALNHMGSAWAHVVAAVRMVLPEVDEATAARLQQLIRQGPPQELVGTDSSALPWPTTQPQTTTGQ